MVVGAWSSSWHLNRRVREREQESRGQHQESLAQIRGASLRLQNIQETYLHQRAGPISRDASVRLQNIQERHFCSSCWQLSKLIQHETPRVLPQYFQIYHSIIFLKPHSEEPATHCYCQKFGWFCCDKYVVFLIPVEIGHTTTARWTN